MNQREKEIIKELVEQGSLGKALDNFDEFTLKNQMLNNEVAQLKARFNINKKHEQQATLDAEGISIEKNKIAKSILSLLDFENENKAIRSKKQYSVVKIGGIIILLLGLIALLYYFFPLKKEKIITGKIYTVENGIERPIPNCLVKIVNVSRGVAGESNEYGVFNLLVEGKNKQVLEFRFRHAEFEDLSQNVALNFRSLKDTLFSREFELKAKEEVINQSFIDLRNKLYRETSQVLGYLTTHTNFKSEEYKSKIRRFWQLYNVELVTVETKEVEKQMVKIGSVISRLNDDLEDTQFKAIKDELFNKVLELAQIFKKEQSQ